MQGSPRRAMYTRLPIAFWIELGLAVAAAVLFLATLVSREWIELVFGVDPDGGSGALEWAIAAGMLTASVTFGALARREWARVATA